MFADTLTILTECLNTLSMTWVDGANSEPWLLLTFDGALQPVEVALDEDEVERLTNKLKKLQAKLGETPMAGEVLWGALLASLEEDTFRAVKSTLVQAWQTKDGAAETQATNPEATTRAHADL